MKVAFVKNMYDSHGPWESIAWKDTNLKDLLFLFPTKVTFWEMRISP